jgi:hypothetical protein
MVYQRHHCTDVLAESGEDSSNVSEDPPGSSPAPSGARRAQIGALTDVPLRSLPLPTFDLRWVAGTGLPLRSE